MTGVAVVRAVALVVVILLAAGCVYYPTVMDVGGIRLRPSNGRVVRQGDTAVFYVNIESTGKFGDVLTGAKTAVAKDAQIVSPAGAPLRRLVVPGTTVVALRPGGNHILLSDLTRDLVQGEGIIVTLVFEKSGYLGAIAVVE